MKKLVSLLLVCVLAISVFASCSNGGSTNSDNGGGNAVDSGEVATNEAKATEYLADKVVIGDYVDIGIDYENQYGYAEEKKRTTLTGWRVIEVSGTGAEGIVTLVSAGNPIVYYHGFDADRDITPYLEMLNDMNKEIVISESGEGFRGNGFRSNDLNAVFSASEFVDISKGIHALGCNSTDGGTETDGEFERLYTAISGKTMSMTQLDEDRDWPFSDETLGLDENSKAYKLLANGGDYILGGKSQYSYSYWEVSYKGWVENSARVSMGIRPVVTLKAGVKTIQNEEGVWELSF